MTPPNGYQVSLPDLRGFASQVDHLGEFYRQLQADFFTKVSTDAFLNEALGTQSQWDAGGALSGVLAQFKSEFLNLMEAEASACLRLCDGLRQDAAKLNVTAEQYESLEASAEDKLDSADSLDEEAREEAEATADAITGGEPNSDWTRRLNLSDYLTANPLDAKYNSPKMKYKDAMSGLEGTWGQVASGSIAGTLDSIVQDWLGFSVSKELIKPFLGNWGFLWYMRDLASSVAEAVTAVQEVLGKSTHTLVAGDWSGPAAEVFADRSRAWDTVLQVYSTHLTAVATLLGDLGDQMEAAVTKIHPMLVTLTDMVIAAIETALTRNPFAILAAGISALVDQIVQGFQPVLDALDGIIELVDASATGTADLCAEADGTQPPS